MEKKNNIMQHFEQLWEDCEKFHSSDNSPTSSILNELYMKIELYKAIDSQNEIPADEKEKIKSRTIGEILFSLTHLSLHDNINVYRELNVALNSRKKENSLKIPKDLKLPKH